MHRTALRSARAWRTVAFNKEKVMDAARKFVDKGQIDKAVKEYLRIVHEDPKDVRVWLKIGDLYAKKGAKQDATETYLKVAERLLWHKPDNHALNRELAGLYLRRNDPRRALQKLQACFKADPRDVETLGLLAQAFQALDQKAKTVSVLKELARVHVENKHRDKAADVYRKILEFVPTDPDA